MDRNSLKLGDVFVYTYPTRSNPYKFLLKFTGDSGAGGYYCEIIKDFNEKPLPPGTITEFKLNFTIEPASELMMLIYG